VGGDRGATRAPAGPDVDEVFTCDPAAPYHGFASCEVTATVGQHLRKGEQLGMFRVRGSTHLLMFRPEAKPRFNLDGQKPSVNSEPIPVNSDLARALG
jgi:phosphatidylserine decarboxylase